MTLIEFRADLWHQKTRIPGLSCDVVCVILRLAVLVELRLVTDGRTDRAMASTADAQHRAVKNGSNIRRVWSQTGSSLRSGNVARGAE